MPSSNAIFRSMGRNQKVSDWLIFVRLRNYHSRPDTETATRPFRACSGVRTGRGPRAHEIRQIRAIASGEAAVGGRRGSPCGPVALADHAARGGVIEISSYRTYVK